MIELLLTQLSNLIVPAGITAARASEGDAVSDKIGFIVLGIIIGPVILLTIAAIIESHKKSRIPAFFLGSFVLVVSAIVLSFAVVGILLKFVIPQ